MIFRNLNKQSAYYLTPRQSEILYLAAAEGLSTKEISSRLYISEKTVETHKHNMMEKAGARSLVHLLYLCLHASKNT